MPAIALRVYEDAQPQICQAAPSLEEFLAPVGAPHIEGRIGTEKPTFKSANLVITAGQKFRMSTGWVQGHRYLAKNDQGVIVGALHVTHIQADGKNAAVASNVFVAPAFRRQGIGARLLQRAQEDFPQLSADSALTADGAALVGITAGPQPVRKPRMR